MEEKGNRKPSLPPSLGLFCTPLASLFSLSLSPPPTPQKKIKTKNQCTLEHSTYRAVQLAYRHRSQFWCYGPWYDSLILTYMRFMKVIGT